MTTAPVLPYIAIIALAFTALFQYLALGRRASPAAARPPVAALVAILGLENLYYGLGRWSPDIYDDLAWYWPGVLAFKVAYILALAYLNHKLNER